MISRSKRETSWSWSPTSKWVALTKRWHGNEFVLCTGLLCCTAQSVLFCNSAVPQLRFEPPTQSRVHWLRIKLLALRSLVLSALVLSISASLLCSPSVVLVQFTVSYYIDMAKANVKHRWPIRTLVQYIWRSTRKTQRGARIRWRLRDVLLRSPVRPLLSSQISFPSRSAAPQSKANESQINLIRFAIAKL